MMHRFRALDLVVKMRRFNRRVLGLLSALLLMGGECDDGAPSTEATLIATEPPNGGMIAANGTLTLTFDNPPGVVRVNGTSATVTDNVAVWRAQGLTPGSATSFLVTWENIDGAATLTFVITEEEADPCAFFDDQNLGFLTCAFDEQNRLCEFYVRFSGEPQEQNCGDYCGNLGGTCLGSADEISDTGAGRCQGSGFTSDCNEEYGSAICTCALPDA